MIFKKRLAFLLAIFMFVLCSCTESSSEHAANNNSNSSNQNSSENRNENSSDSSIDWEDEVNATPSLPETNKWFDGVPAIVGDVFKAPDINHSGGSAPVIAELTHQVDSGNSITVTGKGFSKSDTKAYIYSQSNDSNGKAKEITPIIVDDNTLMVTVDSSTEYGIHGIYIKNSSGTSNIKYINTPKIWWIDLVKVVAGQTFNIYGENLTSDNKNQSYVFLLSEDKKHLRLETVYADPYKVTVKIPDNLENGKSYTILLHNGHGGALGFCEAEEKITFSKAAPVQYNGKVIDVTKFGANPKDKNNDDSNAVMEALLTVQDGDTLYFPTGTYLFKLPMGVHASIKIKGDGADKSKLIIDSKMAENVNLFSCSKGPIEFTQLGFEDIRTTNLTNSFINFTGKATAIASEKFNLNVNNCSFVQRTSANARSQKYVIAALHTSGVVIENNKFEVTGMLWSNSTKKVFIRNNDYCGTCFVGPYYNQNATLIWNTDMLDANNNKFYGKDLLTDKTGIMNKDDYTGGRTFAVQQSGRNFYICNNTMERTGLPDDNAGEQIMLEDVTNQYLGNIEKATATSVTLSSYPKEFVRKNCIVTVVMGNGVTQWRFVKKATSGKEITVTEPWDIIPDKTSTVMISDCFYNMAIYNNKFDCFKNFANSGHTATCGVQIYGNTHNLYITKNVMKNMNYGVCITSHYLTDKDEENGVYWSYLDNNVVEDVNNAFNFTLASVTESSSEPIPIHTSFGVSLRNNKIKNVIDYQFKSRKTLGGKGIKIGTVTKDYNGWPDTNTWKGAWQYAGLIENNTFENCELQNISMAKHQGGMVLLGNKVIGNSPVKDIYTLESTNGAKPFVCK